MDNAKKKRNKRYLSWGLMAALVVLLTAMPLLAKTEAETDGPVATVHSGTVAMGSVSTALHGGGTLSAEDAEEVTLPSGVKITEFLVKNGETVTGGTPLASVDKVSVMTAIVSVTETMEYLQDEMESARDDTIGSTISATAGGRIKKVFAESGEAVQDVMLRDGALALLSIDGLMAVKIQRNMDIRTGDSVCVTLGGDTEVTGRVESNLDGVIIVTIDDEGYAIGESVTVTTDDGDRIGSGTLYVHNAWKATAYSGTISTVSAKEEATVASGATLFTLTDTDYTAQLEYLSAQHREYAQLLQELFQMYESGTINAPCDGQISGVDKDSAHLLAAETIVGEQGWYVDLLSNETENGEKGWTVMLLSSTTYADGECGSDTCTLVGEHTVEDCPKNVCTHTVSCTANKDKHQSDCIFCCDHADTADGCNGTLNHYKDCIKDCDNGKEEGKCSASKHYLTCIESCISSDGTKDCPATGAHKHSCIEDCVHADISGVCEANKYHYSDCIEACVLSKDANTVCSASKHKEACYYADIVYTATAAKVDAVGLKLVVFTDTSNTVYHVERSGSGWILSNGAQLNTDLLVQSGGEISVKDPASFSQGDIILSVTGYKDQEAVWSDVVVYQKAQTGTGQGSSMGGPSGLMGGLAGMDLSGMIGGFSGFGSYSAGGATTQSEVELFDLEGDVLLTVTPQQTVSLTITLDEQDIAKVSVGQAAEVKVEALKGEVFEAEVVEVGKSGTNSGGSSKFTVKLRMDMAENMLDGMSATASIPLATKMDVLTIPVEALVEDGARTVVYTALDEETGAPCDPVEVTTGVSDGITAEILSGLASGDTFYYSYYDVLELDTSAKASRFSFG